MIETLYKTQTPEKGKSECYVLVLTSRAASNGKVYAFMEEHGQWNDDMQRFIYEVNSINTEEQLTYQHARGMYEKAKDQLTGKGFVHSFSLDGMRKESAPEQVPEQEAAVA
jgi:hypothetical protein